MESLIATIVETAIQAAALNLLISTQVMFGRYYPTKVTFAAYDVLHMSHLYDGR